MDDQQLAIFIDRLAKAFATQANQIRTLQSLLMDHDVKPEEMSERQKLLRNRHFDPDVRFFQRHLLGQISGQKRTNQEEQELLDEWWKLDQEPPQPPEDSEDPYP